VGFVFAQNDVASTLGDLSSGYQGQEMPGLFRSLFGDERVNLFVDGVEIHVVTENGVVVTNGLGHISDPTMRVYASGDVLDEIASSENKIGEIQSALDRGEIRYEMVGVGKKVKMALVEVGLRVVSWFV